MKDVTLSPGQFNIQLERAVRSVLDRSEVRQMARLGNPQTPMNLHSKLIWPRGYREIRALLIASWYLPEWLKWEVVLHYNVDFIYSLDFENGGLEHSLEILLLTSSKEVMVKYLLECSPLSARDLFGNVLGSDLVRALRSISISQSPKKVKRKVRRRGYQDKGTWKPPDRWTDRYDLTLDRNQLYREKKKLILELLYTTYLSKLR